MQNVSENVNNGASSGEDRFAGQLDYRGAARREPGGIPTGTAPVSLAEERAGSLGSVMDTPLPTQPTMSLGELDKLAEPVFPPTGWMDMPPGALADHPLLRGLLMELPPKGVMPSAAWLDRWFEATRAILELLYVQNDATVGRR
ncbi:hypothetical protein [Rugosimonospora africana]|nr:hypothetical protein [Rugosimonospora africana]